MKHLRRWLFHINAITLLLMWPIVWSGAISAEGSRQEGAVPPYRKADLAKRMKLNFPGHANTESVRSESFFYFVADEKLNLIRSTLIIQEEAADKWVVYDCTPQPFVPGHLGSIEYRWRPAKPFVIKALRKFFTEPNAKIGNSADLPKNINNPVVYVEHRVNGKNRGYVLDNLNLIGNERDAGLLGKIVATMAIH